LTFSLFNLAPLVPCFTFLFISNDEASKNFTSGMSVIVGSHGLITVLHYGYKTLTKHFCVGLFALGFAAVSEGQIIFFY